MESTTNARNLLMYTGSQFGEIEQLDDIAGTCGIQVFDGSSIKPTEKVAFLESNSHKSDTKTEKIETYFLSLNLEKNIKNNFFYKDSILPGEQFFYDGPNKYLTIGNIPQKSINIERNKTWNHTFSVAIEDIEQLMGTSAYKCNVVDPSTDSGFRVPDNPGAQENDDGKKVYAIHGHTFNTSKIYNAIINGNLVGDLNYGLTDESEGVKSKICKNALKLSSIKSLGTDDPIMMESFNCARLLNKFKDSPNIDTGILTIGNNTIGTRPSMNFEKDIILDGIEKTSGTSDLSFKVDTAIRKVCTLAQDGIFKIYPTVVVKKNFTHEHKFRVGLAYDEAQAIGTETLYSKGNASNKISTKALKEPISFIPIGSIYFGEQNNLGDRQVFKDGSVEPSATTLSDNFTEPSQQIHFSAKYDPMSYNTTSPTRGTDLANMPMAEIKAQWAAGNARNHGVCTEVSEYVEAHDHNLTGLSKFIDETQDAYFENYNTTAYEKLFWD